MYFSDFLILQIHPHFYPKYTNLHQYTKSYTIFAKDMPIYDDL